MSIAVRFVSTFRALVLVSVLSSACEKGDPAAEVPADAPDYRVSTKNDVQWKRYAAFESDLALALELGPASLCSELGQASCIRQVHLMPLGGNEPFDTGILLPSAEPLATTPAVVDRVLLSACDQRVALDRRAPAGQATVFKALDLKWSRAGARRCRGGRHDHRPLSAPAGSRALRGRATLGRRAGGEQRRRAALGG